MMLTGIGVLIVTVFLSFAGFLAAATAAESMSEARGKQMRLSTWLIFILINGVMGLLFKIAHPAVYAIVLIILAILQLLNREGKKRRKSWNILAIAYSIVLILSTVAYFERHAKMFSGWAWLIVIPILLPFIASLIQAIRLNGRKPRKKEKFDPAERRIQLIQWGCVAVLAAIVILLIAI